MTTALEIINESITSVRQTADVAKARMLITGEIGMAVKLGMIDRETQAELTRELLLACQKRRTELHRARIEAMTQ